MTNNILYLEDDYSWKEITHPILAKHGQVHVIDNEYEFRETINDVVSNGDEWPDLVVLEQIVKWTKPIRYIPQHPDIQRSGGPVNAGVRCYEYLRQAEKGSEKIPVIFYSLVNPEKISNALQEKGFGGSTTSTIDYQIIEKGMSTVNFDMLIRRVLSKNAYKQI